jgi:hypothetical protein
MYLNSLYQSVIELTTLLQKSRSLSTSVAFSAYPKDMLPRGCRAAHGTPRVGERSGMQACQRASKPAGERVGTDAGKRVRAGGRAPADARADAGEDVHALSGELTGRVGYEQKSRT